MDGDTTIGRATRGYLAYILYVYANAIYSMLLGTKAMKHHIRVRSNMSLYSFRFLAFFMRANFAWPAHLARLGRT